MIQLCLPAYHVLPSAPLCISLHAVVAGWSAAGDRLPQSCPEGNLANQETFFSPPVSGQTTTFTFFCDLLHFHICAGKACPSFVYCFNTSNTSGNFTERDSISQKVLHFFALSFLFVCRQSILCKQFSFNSISSQYFAHRFEMASFIYCNFWA